MTSFKYLHIMHNEKFITPYINFIKENFKFDEHFFIINGGVSEKIYPILNHDNIIKINYTNLRSLRDLSNKLSPYIIQADKVILHSLFVPNIVNYFFFHKDYLKKCNWIIWGGDLYNLKIKNNLIMEKLFNFRKKQVIKKLDGIICYNKAEYTLAKDWTGTVATFNQSFFYLSNLYEELPTKSISHKNINIQVGNSADQTNRHFDALDKLAIFKNENIKIYIPLSYGDVEYAQEVIQYGQNIFGDKLIPITTLMPFPEYLEFLGKIDIALFNHIRAQAMGNITTLLGLGKKVYIQKNIITWDLAAEAGANIYDIENINLEKIDTKTQLNNMKNIKQYFSRENLLLQWQQIFTDTGTR